MLAHLSISPPRPSHSSTRATLKNAIMVPQSVSYRCLRQMHVSITGARWSWVHVGCWTLRRTFRFLLLPKVHRKTKTVLLQKSNTVTQHKTSSIIWISNMQQRILNKPLSLLPRPQHLLTHPIHLCRIVRAKGFSNHVKFASVWLLLLGIYSPVCFIY